MNAPTTFLLRTYDDALQLLLEARAAFSGDLRFVGDASNVQQAWRISTESFRVTARLTQVMAWILAQRAVQAGEISQAESISDRYGFDHDAEHLAEPLEVGNETLPRLLQDLLERSRLLYLRVMRLDDLVRREVELQRMSA